MSHSARQREWKLGRSRRPPSVSVGEPRRRLASCWRHHTVLRHAFAVFLLGAATLLDGTMLTPPRATAAPSLWTIQPSPNGDPAGNNYLYGVSCVNAQFCVAVGTDSGGGAGYYETLIETWDGATWSVTASPNLGDESNTLSAVSCSTTTSCVAVGDYLNDGGTGGTLVETFDGSSWIITPSPAGGSLNGVSCVTPTDCVAVGTTEGSSSPWAPLIESWDGSAWTVSWNPGPLGPNPNTLYGVSCSSPDSCVAVGQQGSGVLVAMWDGTMWSVAPAPNPDGGKTNTGILNGVACPTATTCVAVGHYLSSRGEEPALVETWNGAAWSIKRSVKLGPYDFEPLRGVACSSSTDCVAVGELEESAGYVETLVESWDGSSWAVTPSPNPSSAYPFGGGFWAVSCSGTYLCVAAGTFYSNSPPPWGTLIESGSAAPPAITRVKPVAGHPGTKVTITGVHLDGATLVTFNGIPATIIGDSATEMTTTVPSGATTGYIDVMTTGGTAQSPKKFKVK